MITRVKIITEKEVQSVGNSMKDLMGKLRLVGLKPVIVKNSAMNIVLLGEKEHRVAIQFNKELYTSEPLYSVEIIPRCISN